jgi:hypothetical protein
MLIHWHFWASVAGVALFPTSSTRSQDLCDVAHTYLQRHDVPCLSVTHVDRAEDMVATCQDGREWALFFVENEVAFVHPRTGDLYRWQREVHRAYPELYGTFQRLPQDKVSAPYGF